MTGLDGENPSALQIVSTAFPVVPVGTQSARFSHQSKPEQILKFRAVEGKRLKLFLLKENIKI
jgi:hypothetical protein